MIQALLAEFGATLAQVDGIAFGAGPGSFTGLRIACGVAQGLALGADLPIVGVSTLEAMAQTRRDQSGGDRVIAALDARMREIYVGAYERDMGRWREVIAPVVVSPEAAAGAGRRRMDRGRQRICGLSVTPQALRRGRFRECDPSIAPGAAAIGKLALPRFAAGEGAPHAMRHRSTFGIAWR